MKTSSLLVVGLCAVAASAFLREDRRTPASPTAGDRQVADLADSNVAERPGAAHVPSPHAERREQPGGHDRYSHLRIPGVGQERFLLHVFLRIVPRARAPDGRPGGARGRRPTRRTSICSRRRGCTGARAWCRELRCRIGRRPAASTRPSSATTARASCTIRSSTATRSARSSDRRRSSAARASASTTASPTCGISSRSRSRPASSRSKSRGSIPTGPAPS